MSAWREAAIALEAAMDFTDGWDALHFDCEYGAAQCPKDEPECAPCIVRCASRALGAAEESE